MVTEVDRDDVARLHHSLRETPIQANRTIALVSKLMSLAERRSVNLTATRPKRTLANSFR